MVATNKLEELHSFVKKFSALWATGSDASLTLESNGGQVHVTLRLGLGEHPSKMYDSNLRNKQKKRLSPSKIRRRERRAAERLSAACSISAEATEEVVSVADNTKVDSIENTGLVIKEATEKVVENVNLVKGVETGDHKCMTKRDEEVAAEKPIAEKTGLWAKSCFDSESFRNVQEDLPEVRNPRCRNSDTLGQLLT